MKIEVDLEQIWSEDYSGTVACIIREELADLIRKEVRKALKGDKKLYKVIKAFKDRALNEAMRSIGCED